MLHEDGVKLKKNDIYEITIEDIGNDGEGIGHVVSQIPAAGTTCQAGRTIQIRLR